MRWLPCSLLLATVGCGHPDRDADVEVSARPSPRGIRTLEPSELRVRVDAVRVRCAGDLATLEVEVIGPADHVEVDLLEDEVVTLDLVARSNDPDVVWQRFSGEVHCTDAATTRVLRAVRGGDLADCAVVGPARDEALAGAYDPALRSAGRPGTTGCRAL